MSARLNIFVFALLTAITLAGCGEKKPAVTDKKGKESPAIPVIVAQVKEQTMPLKIQAIGNVEVQATVSIKSRLDGQIVKVGFSDGQDVAKGQLLFEIDARPLQAQLLQAQAALARDRAQLDRARAQEERYKDLVQKGFVAQDAYAQVRTKVDTAAEPAKPERK